MPRYLNTYIAVFFFLGSASVGTMADYSTYSSYTQYSTSYPTYGYGTGGLLSK